MKIQLGEKNPYKEQSVNNSHKYCFMKCWNVLYNYWIRSDTFVSKGLSVNSYYIRYIIICTSE